MNKGQQALRELLAWCEDWRYSDTAIGEGVRLTLAKDPADRERIPLPSHFCEDPLLVRPPVRKPRQPIPDPPRVRMKDMRAVGVDQDPVLIQVVVAVPCHMLATIYYKHLLAGLRDTAGHYRPR